MLNILLWIDALLVTALSLGILLRMANGVEEIRLRSWRNLLALSAAIGILLWLAGGRL